MSSLGRSTGLSHPGRRRRRNEDAWVCHPPLFAVADGMGGARGGEIASRVAATALGESVDGSGESRVVALIQEANRQVYERAREDSDASGMGTTITVALFENGIVSIGHVGDSRAYLIRDHKVDQLTEDHSLVAELVRSGRLSPEEAESHPQRSVITRVLGTDRQREFERLAVLWRERWDGSRAWFVSEPHHPSQAKLLRSQARAAIPQLLAVVSALNERRAGRSDRSADFRTLATWFAQAPDDAATHRLWRSVFGLSSARHLTVDEDTLTEVDRVPAIDTMVVPPEDARAIEAGVGQTDGAARSGAVDEEEREPKPHLGVQAARMIIALAVVAGLLLLVYWLFGQSQ